MRGIGLLSFALTLIMMPIVIFVLRRLRIFDVPGERSSHSRDTLRGGGLGVYLGATGGLLLSGLIGVPDPSSLKTLMVCVSFFAIVGLIDDIHGLEVLPRLTAQVVCAAIFVGPWFLRYVPGDGDVVHLLVAAIAVLWVVGFLNVFNFMDGINGISALHATLAGLAFAYIGHVEQVRVIEVCGITIAAASLAFLPFNFPQARVFLGDVGSYFIGTWLAITALIAIIWKTPIEAVLAPFVIYLADTSFTLASRIKRRENWRQSHHEHVYQRLIDFGWSHTRTALVVVGFSSVCTVLGLTSLTGWLGLRVASDAAIVLLAVGYLSLPRLAVVVSPRAENDGSERTVPPTTSS